ncbi:MAG: hypothetical protein LUO93_02130 [Methanomicrobiales archaeon]|nr:hypothetical protein [Methanomicrobiales archaeon]
MSAEYLPYHPATECDWCGHRYDEHVEILGCLFDSVTREEGGVKYACGCTEFTVPENREERP